MPIPNSRPIRSVFPSGLIVPEKPIKDPIIKAINIENTANSILAGRALEIITFTGYCVFNEIPKFPWINWFKYSIYWLIRGLSNPSLILRLSLANSFARVPRIASTGSPGAILNNIKTKLEMIQSIIGNRVNLERIYLKSSFLVDKTSLFLSFLG